MARMIRRYTCPKGEAISDYTYNTGCWAAIAATARTVRYLSTVTCQTIGRPGTGVHGVGLHTGDPATKGTVTVTDPALIALRLAVKVVSEAPLDMTANTPASEKVGGPGQVPPDMSSPPVRMRVEPTITQTEVSY